MSNQLTIIDPKEYGLEAQKATEIETAFAPKIAEREGLAIIYAELITKELTEENCKSAGELRRKLVKVRTGIAAIHKSQKAFYLASGKYVDAWKNKETLPVSQMEEKLAEFENYFEVQKVKEIERLQNERVELLNPYLDFANLMDLGTMELDVFDAFLAAKKKSYEDAQAAEKAALIEKEKQEKKEAAERKVAEELKAKEQARIEAENKKLRDKLALQEKAAKEEKEVAQKIQAQKDAKAKEERLAFEKEKARIKKENEQLLAKQAAEEQAKKAEEKRLVEEKSQKEQDELNKNDSEKVKDLISELEAIKTKYSFTSAKNKATYENVGGLIDKITTYIKTK